MRITIEVCSGECFTRHHIYTCIHRSRNLVFRAYNKTTLYVVTKHNILTRHFDDTVSSTSTYQLMLPRYNTYTALAQYTHTHTHAGSRLPHSVKATVTNTIRLRLLFPSDYRSTSVRLRLDFQSTTAVKMDMSIFDVDR